jgi:uncharacterized protein
MHYNVAQLLKEPTGATRDYVIERDFAGPERMADRVAGRLHLFKTHRGVIAQADVDVRATLVCCRCTGEFSSSSQLLVEEECFPLMDVQTGRRLELPEDTDGFQIDADNLLDFAEILRQYIITDQPMKPLCRARCLGLCQVCGGNLNEQECQCSGQAIDPRWAALAALTNPEVNL